MTKLMCPKCNGSDFFYSKRNVTSGAVFQKLRTKAVPVCKQCDEILMTFHDSAKRVNKIGRIGSKVIWAVVAIMLIALIFIF